MVFSAFFLLAPVLGRFLRFHGVIWILLLTKVLKFLLLGSCICLTGGIPTLVGSLCWIQDNRRISFFVNVFIPLICFTLFILNPSVSFGWIFGCYWVIPLVLFFLQRYGFFENSLLVVSLQSSFVAHAVGSVIWAYIVPMSPEQWVVLIPMVAVERFAAALGMLVICKVVNKLRLFYGVEI